MTVKYQIRCSESDIFVLEKDEGYHVTIGSRVNPLSFGNKLADYSSLGKAIDAAEKFCQMYTLSKEYGYHLQNQAFHKEGMKPIPVPRLLELELSMESLREMLERDAMLHGAG